jgi:hypothetical protein
VEKHITESKGERMDYDLNVRFTYHKPFGDQPIRYERIRKWAYDMSLFLLDYCPDSRELSLAITHLEEVVFWANAAIARHEEEKVE